MRNIVLDNEKYLLHIPFRHRRCKVDKGDDVTIDQWLVVTRTGRGSAGLPAGRGVFFTTAQPVAGLGQ